MLLLHLITHNDIHTQFSMTPLDEGSARCRELYLTKHNTHKRKISMPSAGSKPAIPAASSCRPMP